MKVQRVPVGSETLTVGIRAGSPTVVFLHGLAGHSGEWNQVIGHLGLEIGVISPDQRAHGDSWVDGARRVDRQGYTADVDRQGYTADVVALVERFAAGPVVVVGQSMGGLVATLVADARPDLFSRLVLIEAGMDAVTEAALQSLRLWFASWPPSFNNRQEAAAFFGPEKRSTPAWVDGLNETGKGLVRRFDANVMLETMQVLAASDRWPEWERISLPTTLVRASDSAISDQDVARMVELRPDAELVVVADSGHDVHLDQPGQVAAIVMDRLGIS